MPHRSLDISVSDLLLNPSNPRLSGVHDSQVATREAMFDSVGKQTLELARHISERGLNPGEKFFVTPDSDGKHYRVLDGNRRTLALRMLRDPETARGLISDKEMKKLGQWSERFLNLHKAKKVECVSFDSEEEAQEWIAVRHAGEQDGVGTVKWNSAANARFFGKMPAALEVHDLVRTSGLLSDEAKARLPDFPMTSLDRLLTDPSVRGSLGLSLGADKRLLSDYPIEEVVKPLTRIVERLLDPKITVKDIYTAADKKNFIRTSLKKADLPTPITRLAKPVRLDGSSDSRASPDNPERVPRKKGSKLPRPRSSLIAPSVGLRIGKPKIERIYLELCKLPVVEYPNATGALFRVFLELSVDEYIHRHKLLAEAAFRNTKLWKKTQVASDHLRQAAVLTEQEYDVVRRFSTEQNTMLAVDVLHQYLHNRTHAALVKDLQNFWDNLTPLFAAIWPPKPK